MDVNTFVELAAALDVKISHLVNEANRFGATKSEKKPVANAEDVERSISYMYFYDGREKKLRKNMIFASPPENGVRDISLYYMLKQFDEPETCKVQYTGIAESWPGFINYTFKNTNNGLEQMLLIAKEPFRKQGVMGGVMLGVSYESCEPICFKVLVSERPLKECERLIEILKVNNDNHAMIRKTNGFTISEVTEDFEGL